MNKEYMLKISRELIEAFTENKELNLQMEHYFMFSITKFLLAKEEIIKKDCNSKKIEFDILNENLPSILTQYHYISSKMTYEVDGKRTLEEAENAVVLKNTKSSDDKNDKFEKMIKESVWCIDKIRDSLAHGKYEFDIRNHLIVIDNEYDTFDETGKVSHHIFRCSIPPELLSMLGNNIKENENDRLRSFKRYENKTLSTELEKDFYNQSKIISTKYKPALNKIEYKNGFGEVIKSEEHNRKNNLAKAEEKKAINNMVVKAMSETMNTLKLNGDTDNVLTAILYNHLLLLLSDEQRDYEYDKLLLLGVDYSFASKKDDINKTDDITNTIGPIKRILKSLNKQYNKINEYDKVNRCKNIFKNTYNSLLEQIGIRNKSVIKRIRNSIMHGNIEINDGKIKLFDRSDNTSEDTSNQFKCITNNNGLLELISELEETRKYTLSSFSSQIYKLLLSFKVGEDFINKTLLNIHKCLKDIDNNINLDTEMESIFNKMELDDLKQKRELLVNALRNIKKMREEESPKL